MKQISKINGLFWASMLFFTGSFAQTKAVDGFVLKGTVKGLTTGKVVMLRYDDADGSSKRTDSALIKNGSFTLKGKLDAAELVGLQFSPGKLIIKVFIENGNIRVDVETAAPAKVKVMGSVSQDQLNAYENAPEQLKFAASFADISKRMELEKDVDKKKKIRSENAPVATAKKTWDLQWINNFITRNPGSAVGAYLFANYHRFDYEMSLADMDAIVSKFSGAAKKSGYYLVLEKEVNDKKALLPGNIAPDFTLLKRDSTQLILSSMRGKYVMIDFWASWCVPCRKAIPFWKKTYQKYHDKGFEILSVSSDYNWPDWFKAMDIEKMPWPQVVDKFPSRFSPSIVGAQYRVTFIPFYVLLDKEGKILVYSGDEKAVEEKLEQLFN